MKFPLVAALTLAAALATAPAFAAPNGAGDSGDSSGADGHNSPAGRPPASAIPSERPTPQHPTMRNDEATRGNSYPTRSYGAGTDGAIGGNPAADVESEKSPGLVGHSQIYAPATSQ